MPKKDLIHFSLNDEDEYNISGVVSEFGLKMLKEQYELEFLTTDFPIVEKEPGFFSFKIKLNSDKREKMKQRLIQLSSINSGNSLFSNPINLN